MIVIIEVITAVVMYFVWQAYGWLAAIGAYIVATILCYSILYFATKARAKARAGAYSQTHMARQQAAAALAVALRTRKAA